MSIHISRRPAGSPASTGGQFDQGRCAESTADLVPATPHVWGVDESPNSYGPELHRGVTNGYAWVAKGHAVSPNTYGRLYVAVPPGHPWRSAGVDDQGATLAVGLHPSLEWEQDGWFGLAHTEEFTDPETRQEFDVETVTRSASRASGRHSAGSVAHLATQRRQESDEQVCRAEWFLAQAHFGQQQACLGEIAARGWPERSTHLHFRTDPDEVDDDGGAPIAFVEYTDEAGLPLGQPAAAITFSSRHTSWGDGWTAFVDEDHPASGENDHFVDLRLVRT